MIKNLIQANIKDTSWQIYGNSFQVNYLKSNILNNDLAHAYLFCGPENIGKKTVALSFIKSILCKESEAGKFCSRCSNCKQVDQRSHPDVLVIEGNNSILLKDEKHGTTIKNIISNISLKPFNADYKVVLVDNAERMTEEAANALLKTLEEPVGHAVIILVSRAKDSLLSTIVSRTRVVSFFSASNSLMNKLMGEFLDRGTDFDLASAVLGGKIGKLIMFSKDGSQLVTIKDAKSELLDIIVSEVYEVLILSEKLAKEYESKSDKFIVKLDTWMVFLRELLLGEPNTNKSFFNYISEKGKIFVSSEMLVKAIESLAWTINTLRNPKSGFNAKLIVDKVLLDISEIARNG